MKRIYKRKFESNYYGEIRQTLFGWNWAFFRDNEPFPLAQRKEKSLEDAIFHCDQEANGLIQIFNAWELVKVQETSQDNAGSSV